MITTLIVAIVYSKKTNKSKKLQEPHRNQKIESYTERKEFAGDISTL